jgi:hypothetical protein
MWYWLYLVAEIRHYSQSKIPRAKLFWVSEAKTLGANQLTIPIYLNSQRQDIVAEVQLPCSSPLLALRGVAFILKQL